MIFPQCNTLPQISPTFRPAPPPLGLQLLELRTPGCKSRAGIGAGRARGRLSCGWMKLEPPARAPGVLQCRELRLKGSRLTLSKHLGFDPVTFFARG